MEDKSGQSKLPGIIIIIIAIFLIAISFFYTKYSRREYMVYLAGSNSDVSLLTDNQISDELNNICLPKLKSYEMSKFDNIIKNKDFNSDKDRLEVCRNIIRKSKTPFTIKVDSK